VHSNHPFLEFGGFERDRESMLCVLCAFFLLGKISPNFSEFKNRKPQKSGGFFFLMVRFHEKKLMEIARLLY
jgi:hypothetical protein